MPYNRHGTIDWQGTICEHRLACDHRLAWNHRAIDWHGTIDCQTEEENVLSLLEIHHRTSENECYLEQIKTSVAPDCVQNFWFP